MDKYEGNYQAGTEFPFDMEALQYIADNRRMVEMLGKISGDKVILSGCVSNGTTRTEGYVYVGGEVLRFIGGSGAYMHVVAENISVTADGHEYSQAYNKRYLAAGQGTIQAETYRWSDFVNIDGRTNRELAATVALLQDAISGLQGVPIGTVEIFAGSTIPNKYLLCNGQAVSQQEYSDLFDVIGHTYDSMEGHAQVDAATQFCVPNLEGRFVCGRTASGEDSTLGKTGGAKDVTLTAAQSGLPAHGHVASTNETGAHTHGVTITGSNADNGDPGIYIETAPTESYSQNNPAIQIANAGAHTHTVTVQQNPTQDAAQAHENRPPYYVLAYIIKAKN